MRGLIWFQEDLRSVDNKALSAACEQCCDGLVAVYSLNRWILNRRSVGQRKVDFLLAASASLQKELKKKNIPLIIFDETSEFDLLDQIKKLVFKYQLEALFFNHTYDLLQSRLVAKIKRFFKKSDAFHDRLIIPPESIKTKQGNPYQVFTPFKNRWLEQVGDLRVIRAIGKPKKIRQPLFSMSAGGSKRSLSVSEKKADTKLTEFLSNRVHVYDRERDYPANNGTSELSPYLSAGVISSRQCIEALMKKEHFDRGEKVWLNELIWREFYSYVIYHHPSICQGKPFKLETDKIPWVHDERLLDLWKAGKTGFSMVDAGMRQLNETGWMHNRVRMITAIFLTKLLLIDWRLGERYFATQEIDYDFAANNGGWQWCASTGVDAVPYFRIFNPTAQSKKYDPNGDYIRQYVPELSDVEAPYIHEPQRYGVSYVDKVVDYRLARERAILAFRQLKK